MAPPSSSLGVVSSSALGVESLHPVPQNLATTVVQPRAVDTFGSGFKFGELVEVRLERDSSECASPLGFVLAQNVNNTTASLHEGATAVEPPGVLSLSGEAPQPLAPSFGTIIECTFERGSLGLAVAKTVGEDGLSALRITKATGQAEQFGLSVGDVIVSLNGEPLPPGGLHPAAFKALIKTLGRPFRLVAGRNPILQAPYSTYNASNCASGAQRLIPPLAQPPKTPPKPPPREELWARAVVSACYKDGSYGIVIQGSEELLDIKDLSVVRRPLMQYHQQEENGEGAKDSGSSSINRSKAVPPTTPLYEAAKLAPPSGIEPALSSKVQGRKDVHSIKAQPRKKVEVPAKKVSSKIEKALMEERNRRRRPKSDPHSSSASATEGRIGSNNNDSKLFADENEASNETEAPMTANAIDKQADKGDAVPHHLTTSTTTTTESSPSKASPRKLTTSKDLKAYLLAPLPPPPSLLPPEPPVDAEVLAAGGPWTDEIGRAWLCRAGFAECSPLRGASQRFQPSMTAFINTGANASKTISSSSSFHSAAPSENHWTMSGSKPVHAAAAMGEVCALAWLLASGVPVEDLRSTNDDHLTPAHFAASQGHLNCLKFLAKHGGADILRAKGYKARTPYYCAAAEGHLGVLTWLHQCIDARDDLVVFDRLGELPLHAAARANQVACLRAMHRFALDLARRGWEAELMANEIRLDAARAAKDLAQRGPSCLEAVLHAGLAARGLSRNDGAVLSTASSSSSSGYDRSSGVNSEDTMSSPSKAQLKDLANPTRLVDENGGVLTVHVAAAHGCTEAVRFLVAEDAAAARKRNDKRNRNRRQHARAAEAGRREQGVREGAEKVAEAQEELDEEEKEWVPLPEVRTKHGDWAALLAAERGHTQVLAALVEVVPERKGKGQRSTSRISKNMNAHPGTEDDANNQCLRILTTSDQMPPFAYACARGHLETCQWLLLHGGLDLSPLLLSSNTARAALCEGKIVLRRTMNALSGARGFGNLGPFNRFAAAEVQTALKAWAPQLLADRRRFISTFLFGLSWRPNPLDNAAASSKNTLFGGQQRPTTGSEHSETAAQRLSRLKALGIDTTGLGLDDEDEEVDGSEIATEAAEQLEEKAEAFTLRGTLEGIDGSGTRETVKGGGCPKLGLPLLASARDVVAQRVADFLGLPMGQSLRRLREYSDLFGLSE